jgi:hypothetical protein
MNKNKTLAAQQIELALDWVVGSYKHDREDGIIDTMPTLDELISDVYEQVMNWTHTEFGIHSKPVHQARFAGKDFIMSYITDKIKDMDIS